MLTLRRRRLTGPVIARRLGRPVSTVGVVLRRHGLGRLRALDPRPPVIRYQRERPGELIHIDIKKLGRIDVFWVLAVVMVALVFVVLMMKRSVAENGARIGAE